MRTPVKNFRISAQVLHVPKTAKNAKVFGGRGGVCYEAAAQTRADSGSPGHGSNGSTNVNRSWVST